MKKFIKIIALVLSIYALSMTFACGDKPSVGSQNMSNIMNAIYTGKIAEYGNDSAVSFSSEDVGHEGGLGNYEVGNYFAQVYAKSGRRGAYYKKYDGPSAQVNGVVFKIDYNKQISEGEENDKLLGLRRFSGELVWDEDTGNFHIEAKIWEGATDTDYGFRLSNLSIDEYYNNGSFDATNCKVEDIETSDDATMILQDFVPFVVEGINKCLDVIDEVYSAKGYPIGK